MITTSPYADTLDAIIETGGATFRYDTMIPTDGYMVSLPDHEVIIDVHAFTPDRLRRYMADTFDLLTDHPDLWWGVWISNGLAYLDISQHIQDRDEAFLAGDLHDQRAIFDLRVGQPHHLTTHTTIITKDRS